MLKVVVTGANGNIGSELVKALLREGNELISISDSDKRIEDGDYFEGLSKPDEIDVLYHLAAASFVPESWRNPPAFIKSNVLGTTRILEFCRKYHVRLVYVSSYAYGIPQYLPIDEKHPVSAVNPYGLSKIMGEDLCRFYGDNYEVDYAIVRPFNVYGTLKNKALLIPEIIEQIKFADEIRVKDLRPKRDYIFIDDLIDLLVEVKNHTTNQVYNAGSGESYSVGEIIGICQEVWRTDLSVYSDETERKNEIPDTRCDISKVKKELGWTPKFSFKEGIKQIKQRIENE